MYGNVILVLSWECYLHFVQNSYLEYEDEIYPYATFQITNPCRTKEQLVSSERAFKTFIYQGSGFIEEESYAATQVNFWLI